MSTADIIRNAFIGIAAGLVSGTILILVRHHWQRSRGRAAVLSVVAFIGGVLVIWAAVTVFNGISASDGETSSSKVTSTHGTGDAGLNLNETIPMAPRDTDRDGVSDAQDECDVERGSPPIGCPDTDGDGVINKVDRCPRAYADTENGCPSIAGLERLDAEERVNYVDESASRSDDILLKGHQPAAGVMMGIGVGYDSASVAIQANGEYETLRGKVGLTPETCPGEYVTVVVRDEYGHALWKDAASFDPRALHVPITGVGRVELYAQAAGESQENCYIDGSHVGWIGIRLVGSS